MRAARFLLGEMRPPRAQEDKKSGEREQGGEREKEAALNKEKVLLQQRRKQKNLKERKRERVRECCLSVTRSWAVRFSFLLFPIDISSLF
ncbi:UNVERIFIED_CONTAM: hypothetical protein HHA_451790 [Hammondia hammondi]|eukprot:XP_008884772.1 hypothetical protein HHA_451790 [Hammondia hammondi]